MLYNFLHIAEGGDYEAQENLNISDVMNSKLFTYDEVHKLLRNFNFQFAWVEPEEFDKWIIENVK